MSIYLPPVIYEVLPFIYGCLGIASFFACDGFIVKMIGVALLSAAYVILCVRSHYREEHGVESWINRKIFRNKNDNKNSNVQN